MVESSNRAKFTFSEGRLELEGSETFVAAQIAKLEPLLLKLSVTAAGPTGDEIKPPAMPGTPKPASAPLDGAGLDAYLNLFSVTPEGGIQILKSIPGNGKSAKSYAVAQLLAYANDLRGIKQTQLSDIRAVCTEHACLDASNFSAIFKSTTGKSHFTVSKGAVTLTHPGKTAAKQLADTLNA